MRSVAYTDELPMHETTRNIFSGTEREDGNDDVSSSPEQQGHLNDFAQHPNCTRSKRQAELLGRILKCWNLLHHETKVCVL